jgi:hypothetical protein
MAKNCVIKRDENGEVKVYNALLTDKGKVDFQIIGEKGANNLAPYKSSLEEAKRLESQGVSANEIEARTRWYKYKGSWKMLSPEVIKDFYITKKVEKNKEYKLKEVLKDENIIFKIYPQLGEYKVIFVDTNQQDTPQNLPEVFKNMYGAYDNSSRTVFLNTSIEGVERRLSEQQYTLAHEVSHIIQEIEGFPAGGNKESILNEALDILKIEPKEDTLFNLFNKIKSANKTGLTENEKNIVDTSLKTIEYIVTGNDSALSKQYRNLLGEIDANIVEGALQVRDRQGVLATSYLDLLTYYKQNFNIDENSIFLLRNGDIRFQITEQQDTQNIEEAQEVLEQLKKTGLANNTYLLSNDEIIAKLVELGVDAAVDKQVDSPYYDIINGFYSPLEKIISETKIDKLPAKQWIDKFAKGEEAKWTGLTDWLQKQEEFGKAMQGKFTIKELKNGKFDVKWKEEGGSSLGWFDTEKQAKDFATGLISKADIQNYLKENRIEIKEVVKGEDSEKVKELLEKRNALYIKTGDIEKSINAELSKGVNGADFSVVNALMKEKNKVQNEYEEADKELNLAKEDDTKYSQYQLEGEKEKGSYKEILVTLPPTETQLSEIQKNALDAKSAEELAETMFRSSSIRLTEDAKDNGYKDNDGSVAQSALSLAMYNEGNGDYYGRKRLEERLEYLVGKEQLQQAIKLGEDVNNSYKKATELKNKTPKGVFQSSHFDEPNILVHLRMNTRIDSEGNKILMLEEIQSDFSATYRKSQEEVMNFISKNEEGVIELYKKSGKLEVEC